MLISAKTEKGPVRPNNQDSYSYGFVGETTAWAVVCDGMGGSAAGNIASENTVSVISKSLTDNLKPEFDVAFAEKLLMRAVYSANASVYEKSLSSEEYSGMGTTIVSCIVCDDNISFAHVGDSRAYICGEKSLIQVTTDHSIVQNMLENGQITVDEAKNHPRKNIITRAVGVNKEITVDINSISVKSGDTIILCTDGLSNSVDSDRILHIVKNTDFNDTADALVNEAIKSGATDNITVVLIKI